MTPDIERLLRDQLRGAATHAPQGLGVDDHAVLTRGRRVLVRRRILTATGVAAATLAVAGTIGVLAPRADNDALPALPTPTVTPTPEATPTITASASATATASSSATASPTVTQTSRPSATPSSTGTPRRTTSPSSTPSRTKTPGPSITPASGLEWSDPISVGGVTYRARLVRDGLAGEYPNYKAELRANGTLVYTRYEANGEYGLRVASDPHVIYASDLGPLSDVISENGQPVSGEQFTSITLPFPDTGHEYPKGSMIFTIIKLPNPATATENGNVANMVVRTADGTQTTLCEGYCGPEN